MLDPNVAIRVHHVVKSFKDVHARPVRVLNGVTFDVIRGETLVVMGGSGCGKSTLLNCLIGEYRVDEGSILYQTKGMSDPADLCSMSENDLNALRKRFGILFQGGALFNSMTLAENVALPLVEHSYVDPSVIDIVVTLKLQQVQMLAHRNKMPSQLSGGQKKRAALARATALDPQILFYDEPSAGLDPVTSAAIDELMIDLSKKLRVTSVVVTHEMDSAFRIADRMVMLDKGRVLKIAPREAFSKIRDADPDSLTSPDEQLMHQFLNGLGEGPLTASDGTTEFERLILGGD